MKKIINGRKYDTSTAEEIGYHSFGFPGDFDFVCETLYRKRTGEFFIHGEGGPRSIYSRQESYNSWSSGEEICPITKSEAKEWMELHCSAEEYESVFGEIEE